MIVLEEDTKRLAQCGVKLKGAVDLNALVKRMDPNFDEKKVGDRSLASKSNFSLNDIVKLYTGRHLVKGPVRCSDWEAEPLSEEQQRCE